MGQNKIMLYWC